VPCSILLFARLVLILKGRSGGANQRSRADFEYSLWIYGI
jgi:hypothetical protein